MMSAPPDPTRNPNPDDFDCKKCGKKMSEHTFKEMAVCEGYDKCKACGKVKSEHTPREKRDCENFSYHMENKK